MEATFDVVVVAGPPALTLYPQGIQVVTPTTPVIMKHKWRVATVPFGG